MHRLIALTVLFLAAQEACADIYSYTAEDGTVTFTDRPLRRSAVLIMKETSRETERDTHRSKAVLTAQKALAAGHLSLPVSGRIASVMGPRIDPFTGDRKHHHGIDIAVPEGTPVRAVAPGVVAYSGNRGGYGNLVIVNHGNGMTTLYAHTVSNLVTVGTFVETGSVLALSGSTGRSTGPHVHFEAWQDGLNITGSFLSPSHHTLSGNLPLSIHRKPDPVRKIIMADGTILLTNMPLVHP